MGRAGAGGSSGGHSSGGHSSSRVSGGHHVSSSGSSHRAGSSSSFSFNSSPRRSSGSSFGAPPHHSHSHSDFDIGFDLGKSLGRMTPPPPPPPRNPYSYPPPSYGSVPRQPQARRRRNPFSVFLYVLLFIILWSTVMSLATGGSSSVPKSSYNREKVNTGVAFQNDCIVDEIGWFDNIPQTERRLQNFYKETGIQPYIVLHKYDSSLTSDSEKEAYANKYYEDNIDNEGTFLFMYFAEQDTDNDVGYMCYVNGKQVTSVMDSEAVDIFWAYVDNNWYSDMSTDDMFVTIFNKTADRIMAKTTTGVDVGKKVVTLIIVIVAIGGVLIVMKTKRKHEHERAEETERILNTPLRSSEDDLADKYLNK